LERAVPGTRVLAIISPWPVAITTCKAAEAILKKVQRVVGRSAGAGTRSVPMR
jgi:hypothetical protein